jgi:hypothetical protein
VPAPPLILLFSFVLGWCSGLVARQLLSFLDPLTLR